MRISKPVNVIAAIAVFTSIFVGSTAQAQVSNSCKIQKSDFSSNQSVGWPKSTATLQSIGSPNILVMGIDFEDDTEAGYAEQVLFWTLQLNKVSEYFKTVSSGLFDPNFEIVPNWLRMPESSSFYGNSTFQNSQVGGEWATSKLSRGALNLVRQSVDLSKFSAAVTVVSGGNVLSGNISYAFTNASKQGIANSGIGNFIVVGKGAMQVPGIDPWKVIAHELNHLLGLDDFYLYGKDGWWQAKSSGAFGIQSYLTESATDSLGWDRWLLNWIPDSRVTCQSKSESVENIVLGAREVYSKTNELFVMKLTPTKVLVIEALTAKGYESNTYPDSVLVYTVDSSIKSGEGPVRIIAKPTKITLSPLSSALPDWVRFKEAPLTPNDYVRFEDFLIINNGKIGEKVSISFYVGKAAEREFASLENLKNLKFKSQSALNKGTKF